MKPLNMRCERPLRAECQGVQVINHPTEVNGKIINRCPHCRGPLRPLSKKEFRELQDAQNELKDGGD
jgi:uncharacterized protein with PIN domain